MDFARSPRALALQQQLRLFTANLVLPSMAEWHRWSDAGEYPLDLINGLKAQARGLGLWNLFLPSLRSDQPGTRLSNLDYAPLAETMGRVPWAAEVFNCNAPDSGTMELLQIAANADQAQRWLHPLLAGQIRSCFAMSEPDTASSDPTHLKTRMQRDGDHWVLDGRKWFIIGAAHPLCRLAMVLGVSNAGARRCPAGRPWRRLCAGPGAAGAGPGTPCDAQHRPVRAGSGVDVRARDEPVARHTAGAAVGLGPGAAFSGRP